MNGAVSDVQPPQGAERDSYLVTEQDTSLFFYCFQTAQREIKPSLGNGMKEKGEYLAGSRREPQIAPGSTLSIHTYRKKHVVYSYTACVCHKLFAVWKRVQSPAVSNSFLLKTELEKNRICFSILYVTVRIEKSWLYGTQFQADREKGVMMIYYKIFHIYCMYFMRMFLLWKKM